MPESDINVVITRLGILSDDVGELKETLRQIATAVTRLALVEERQSQTNEALGRAFKSIDKIDGKIGSNTRWLIGQYERSVRMKVGCWPRQEVLEHLRRGLADGR